MKSFNYLNPPVRREFLGFGILNVPRNTVQRMRQIILESSQNDYVRKWAEKMIERVPDRDARGEVDAIYMFLQDHTRYTRDPLGVEYIQTPPYVLKQLEIGNVPALDCDDYAVTGLSLLRSIGYKTGIRTAAYNKKKGFSHVYGLVQIGPDWVVFDPVRKGRPLGWEAPNAVMKEDVKV